MYNACITNSPSLAQPPMRSTEEKESRRRTKEGGARPSIWSCVKTTFCPSSQSGIAPSVADSSQAHLGHSIPLSIAASRRLFRTFLFLRQATYADQRLRVQSEDTCPVPPHPQDAISVNEPNFMDLFDQPIVCLPCLTPRINQTPAFLP